MSFYPDLSPYTYHVEEVNSKLLNISWLSVKHPFPNGSVSEAFLTQLWTYCEKSVNDFRGFHQCDFCKATQPTSVTRNGKELRLGAAEVWVPGNNGIVYIAPNLVYHYVTVHDYMPPREFIDAVLDSPQPNTSAYIEFLDRLDVDYQFIDDDGEIIAAGGRYRELAANEEYRAALKVLHAQ